MFSPAILLLIVVTNPVIRAERLVTQLGGPTFAGREKVGKELVTLGRCSIVALQRGASHRDLEISERCQRLLPLAEVEAIRQRVAFLLETPPKPVPDDVPLATKLLSITGDTREARQLYVDIYVANADVLERISRAGAKGGDVFWDWIDKVLAATESTAAIERGQAMPTPRPVLTRSDVALYWLLSTDAAFKPSTKSRATLQDFRFDRSAAARDSVAASNGSALRRLLIARLAGPRNYDNVGAEATRVQEAFKLVADAKFKDARPIVLKIALKPDEWHVVRAAALMALMRIGESEDIAILSAMITDNTNLGTSKAGQTMLGDVALAACIQLSGQELRDFGFKHADAGQAEGCTDALHFGFVEASSRDAARESWKRKVEARKTVAGVKK